MTAALRARAPAAQDAPSAVSPRVHVTITSTRDGFLGTLAVQLGDQRSSRQLSSHRCEDLVAALALVAAMAMERDAERQRTVAAARIERPVARADSPWAIGVAGGGGAAFGVTPDPMPVAELGAHLARDRLGHVGLAIGFGRDRDRLEVGEARFTWIAGRASACFAPRALGAFEPAACAHVEVGDLRAGGRDIVNQRDVDRLWLAIGPHAGLRWLAEGGYFAELRVGASVPLLRNRFFFLPSEEIHQAPAVTPWLSAGLGYRFR